MAQPNIFEGFHIVILVETQSVSFSFLPEYHQYEIPAARPGAKGEGVCLLVHPDIAHGVSLWRRMPSTPALWLILRASITGADSDVYLGGVYIPPAQSALLRNSTAADRFAALAEAASAASALGKVMLMGDFNARVADRPDIDETSAGSLQALDLPAVRACTDTFFGGQRLMTACSTTFCGLHYNARGFMATCWQPFSRCIVEAP